MTTPTPEPAMDDIELPPLPHPVMNAMLGDDWADLFTADQLRAHAATEVAALIAESDRLREELERARVDVERWRKTAEYFRAGQEQRAPKWVPAKVWLAGPVRGDYPIGHTTIAHEGEYECKSNRYGAVSVLAENGKWLGVKPSEFDVVEWRENLPTAALAARKGEA